jgi:predicted dehydrogenase
MGGFISRVHRMLGYGTKSIKSPNALRIGILGAATIAPFALIYPALYNANIVVTSVAARDISRAKKFAKKHSIPNVYSSYAELLNQPNIDVVYIPSPNGYHLKCAIEALKAGKHILLEKPITANLSEALELEKVAKECDRLIMEASHCFYHPALIRAREIVRSGELGDLIEVESAFQIPLIPYKDIRFNINGTQSNLAGGAFMDTGVYACNVVRFLTDLKYEECIEANAKQVFPGVDKEMSAIVKFENSTCKGQVKGNMRYAGFDSHVNVKGSHRTLYMWNFVLPSSQHSITIKEGNKVIRVEHVYGTKGQSTYEYQLDAFVEVVQKFQSGQGGYVKTIPGGSIDDPINTMKMVDGIYTKSGLGIRKGVTI